jgi:hypothetical protein
VYFNGQRTRAGDWKLEVKSKALAHRHVCLSKTPMAKASQTRRLQFEMDVKRSMPWLPGCDRNMAAHVWWVSVIESSMVERVLPDQQS